MKTRNAVGEQGMTLIEMMLVLALVAMMSFWSLDSWHGYRQRMQLVGQAQRLRLYLTLLQAQAWRYNQTYPLWVIAGPAGCVGSGKRPTDCSHSKPETFRLNYPGLFITDYSKHPMGFYGRRNMARAGHITLGNAAGRVRLVISSRGRLRWCSEERSIPGLALC